MHKYLRPIPTILYALAAIAVMVLLTVAGRWTQSTFEREGFSPLYFVTVLCSVLTMILFFTCWYAFAPLCLKDRD